MYPVSAHLYQVESADSHADQSRHRPKPGPSKCPSSAVPPRLPSGNNMARTTGCCENGLNAPSRSSSSNSTQEQLQLARRPLATVLALGNDEPLGEPAACLGARGLSRQSKRHPAGGDDEDGHCHRDDVWNAAPIVGQHRTVGDDDQGDDQERPINGVVMHLLRLATKMRSMQSPRTSRGRPYRRPNSCSVCAGQTMVGVRISRVSRQHSQVASATKKIRARVAPSSRGVTVWSIPALISPLVGACGLPKIRTRCTRARPWPPSRRGHGQCGPPAVLDRSTCARRSTRHPPRHPAVDIRNGAPAGSRAVQPRGVPFVSVEIIARFASGATRPRSASCSPRAHVPAEQEQPAQTDVELVTRRLRLAGEDYEARYGKRKKQ